jgi:hypothetical protein
MERERTIHQQQVVDPLHLRAGGAEPAANEPPWQRSITAQEIFEQLLADEIRAGRLCAAGRRRVMAYGAQLGLSPAQVARMIERSRDAVLTDDDPAIRHHALELIEPPPQRVPVAYKIALVIALAIAVDVLILGLWSG